MYFTLPKKAIGLDIGTASVKAVQMGRSGGRLVVEEVAYAPIDRSQFSADPTTAQGVAAQQALEYLSPKKAMIIGALQGQSVVIRYPRIPETTPAQLEAAVMKEAANNIPYDLNEVFLDWYVLDQFEENSRRQMKLLLVAAKHEIINSRMQVAQVGGFQFHMLGVDSLALSDAAEQCDFLRVGETVALVDIGLTSSSIHFVKDGISNFIRDVNWGSREMIQALMKEYRCDYEKAQKYLYQSGDITSGAIFEKSNEEPEHVSLTEEDSIDPFAADAGSGGSLLDPLDEELGGASLGLDPAPQSNRGPRAASGSEPSAAKIRDSVASHLSKLVTEIRRSFDYYEHQLYERPVDGLILSGGIAHLPILTTTLIEDLGIENVDVANPTNSALVLGNQVAIEPMIAHPAQFMVAIGLAAKGMAEL